MLAQGFSPAFSLERQEALLVNFGERAFRYSPSGTTAATATEDISGGGSIKAGQDDVSVTPFTAVNGQALLSKQAGQQTHPHSGAADTLTQEQFAPLDLESPALSSTEALRALGLMHLKAELARRGLKTGGDLAQRAERLHSVRGLAEADIPTKLRAKGA